MKIVVFDVDDTLYDQTDPFKKAMITIFPEICESLGNELSQLYLRFRYYSDKVFHLTENGTLALDDMRIYRIKEALNDFSYTISTADASAFQKSYHDYQGKITLKQEIMDILVSLEQRNVPIAILTNGPTDHQKRKIKQLGLEELIVKERVFISEEIGVAKPDKGIFQQIEETFDRPASDFIYIGDSYENDVVGSKGADWSCIWLNKYQRKIPQSAVQPNYELANYVELAEKIEKLLK